MQTTSDTRPSIQIGEASCLCTSAINLEEIGWCVRFGGRVIFIDSVNCTGRGRRTPIRYATPVKHYIYIYIYIYLQSVRVVVLSGQSALTYLSLSDSSRVRDKLATWYMRVQISPENVSLAVLRTKY